MSVYDYLSNVLEKSLVQYEQMFLKNNISGIAQLLEHNRMLFRYYQGQYYNDMDIGNYFYDEHMIAFEEIRERLYCD